MAQTFYLWKKDIRYQYIKSFQINCFLSITLTFILSLVSRGLVLFKVILVGTGVQLKLRKHPNAYIAIKWNLNLLVITFLTTFMPLARVVLRNDASPSDGDNKRLVCVRGDQCHDHIKRHPEKSRLMPLQGPLLHSPEWRVTSLVSIHYEEVILK